MWVKPKRYTALLFGSPDHYERVVFTSIDGGWGDFELLRYNGKIPRYRYVIVYDRKYAIAQGERLNSILKNEWNYIVSEFKTIIPDKNDPEFGSTKKRAKWVVIHFSAIAKQVKRTMADSGSYPPESSQRISAGPSAYNADVLPADLYDSDYSDSDYDDDDDFYNPSDFDDYDDSFSWTTEIPDADIGELHTGYSDAPSGTATPTKGFKILKNKSAHSLYHDDQNSDLYKQGRSSYQQLPPPASQKQTHPADTSALPRSSLKVDSSYDVLPWVMPHSQPSSPGLGMGHVEGDQILADENTAPSPVPDKQQQYPPALPIAVQVNSQKQKAQVQNEGIIIPTPAHGSAKKKPVLSHQAQQQQQQQLKMQCQKQLLQAHQVHVQQEQQKYQQKHQPQQQVQQQQPLQQQQQQQQQQVQQPVSKSFSVRFVEGIANEAADISKMWKKFWNYFVESWLYVHYIYVWVVALTEEAPTKEQRTKKYIVYSCLGATLASLVLHYSYGALFLIEIIALNYACVYCVRHRGELVKKTIVMKASRTKDRKITRIIRAVQGKDQKGVKNAEDEPSSSSASAQANPNSQDLDVELNISAISPSALSVLIPGTSSQTPSAGGNPSNNPPKRLTREEKKEIKEEKEREKKEIKEEKEREKKEIKEEKEREKKEIKEEKEREKKEQKEEKERERKEQREEKEREKREERERKEKRKEEKAMSAGKDEKRGVRSRFKWKRASQMITTDYNAGAPEDDFVICHGGDNNGPAPFEYPVDDSSELSFNQEKRAFSDEDDDDNDISFDGDDNMDVHSQK